MDYTNFGLKPCPKCGSTDIRAGAFSISEDCYMECNECGYIIEDSVPWNDCHTQQDHDNKCFEKLKIQWNNR